MNNGQRTNRDLSLQYYLKNSRMGDSRIARIKHHEIIIIEKHNGQIVICPYNNI